ncbi:MAG: HNH endonuclease, partial [Bdellovibrionales bacterium]
EGQEGVTSHGKATNQDESEVFTCTANDSPSGYSTDSVVPPSSGTPAQAEGPETHQAPVPRPSVPQPVQKPAAQKPAVPKSNGRLRVTVAQREATLARDGGRCTHVDAQGRRCSEDKWLDVHHIRPVSAGGGHHLDNLTTLCRHHHDLVHQFSLPIEGQVSWLRAPQVGYGTSAAG